MNVREATLADVPAITEIYAHHVLHGFGTFEEVPPGHEEMAARMAAVQSRDLPYLVAEVHGRVVGFAYAGLFRPRTAYRYTAEDSVYVAPDRTGQGVGRTLLEEVCKRCEAIGLRSVLAVIGDSGNAGSIGVHRSCGFEMAGVLRGAGFKHGRWVDVVLMRLELNGGDSSPPVGDGWAFGG
ncbi:GNAT family N-acetyltransferase [Caulobacter sp. 17J80-11]|uniref:GNAT family N-acetyltransferase n=1 Tax=Caulobacter sp. 17J80-11 TaxID=2763502 RepID=UPI001653CE83|nr:N-acetyltransferase [Caulobacter sp. 17J80-11]